MARALLLLALLALLAPAQAQLSGQNVCTRSQAQNYYSMQSYTTSCGPFGLTCTRYRTVLRTRYVTRQYCCSGYIAVGSECQPMCNGVVGDAGCNAPHGRCDSPNHCTCLNGYSGPDCSNPPVPCPPDECSNTGFTPCTSACPWNVDLDPEVVAASDDHGLLQISTLLFMCQFTPAPQQLLYDVLWFVNNVTVAHFTRLPSNKVNTKGSLRENVWKDITSLNMVVRCSLRVYNKRNQLTSRIHDSDPFFAGLEVNETAITVKEGESGVIWVRSTVPLPYIRLPFGPRGSVSVFVFSPIESFPDYAIDNVTFSRGNCRVELTSTDWVQLEVTAAKDNNFRRTRISLLRLGVDINGLDVNGVWNNVTLPDVKITITDEDRKLSKRTCWSLNDPHMRTFDGRPYENQRIGEFILYSHTLYPFSVHVKYHHCSPNSFPKCNCGVAVRAYDSLVVVDRCRTSVGRTTTFLNHIAYTGCNDRHLLLTNRGNKYTVTLPTGTKVEFTLHSSGMHSVYVYPSPADVDLTRGLCGRLSSTFADDFMLRDETITNEDQVFAENWRVTRSSESLFVANPTLIQEVPVLPYCFCDENTGPASNSANCSYPYPAYQGPQLYSSNLRAFLHTCEGRAGRDLRASDYVSDGPSGWEDGTQLSGTQQEHERRRRSAESEWLNGWTETSAREHCHEAFASSRGVALMEEATGFTSVKEDMIETCILDVKYTAGTTYTKFTVEAFKDVCEEEVQKNVTLLETDVGRSLVEEIANASCPLDCSNRGTCQEGRCQCEEGFLGVDCSVERSTPPQNPHIPRQGLCNTTERACLSTPVLASNLDETGTVFCSFRAFQFLQKGIRESSQRSITEAEPWIQGQVQCPFPSPRTGSQSDVMAMGYMVSISNDNVTYSSEIPVVIYDGRCLSCSTDNLTCIATGLCDTIPPFADPCSGYTYKRITGQYKRSVGYNSSSGESQLCDVTLESGWYRFQSAAGNDMVPLSDCSLGRCGTIFPVCLKDGSLPTVGEGEVSRTVCRMGVSGCGAEWTIKIRNCGAFRIYHLPPSDTCPSAYCVGTQVRCAPGLCSSNGFTPGCRKSPCYIWGGIEMVPPQVGPAIERLDLTPATLQPTDQETGTGVVVEEGSPHLAVASPHLAVATEVQGPTLDRRRRAESESDRDSRLVP